MNNPKGIRFDLRFRHQIFSGQVTQREAGSAAVDKRLVILLIVSLFLSTAVSYLLSKQSVVLIHSDHFSRWYATYKMVTDHRSLYDPQNGKEIVALFSNPDNPIVAGFYYPAYLIVLTLPFVGFPYPLAHFIWLTLIQLFLIIGIWLVFREIKWPNSINQFTLVLFLSILFIPNIQNTIWGQFNTISVISLALVYVCLRRHRYLLAGLIATGMAFKPQQLMLPLLFLLLWALYRRERWKFLYGFVLGMLILGLFANLFEPNWVNSFIQELGVYSTYLHPPSVLGLSKIYGWILFIIMAIACLWLYLRNLASTPNSIAFVGCIILSTGIWWLSVPVIGMMHLVALPILILLLFASLERLRSRLYKYGIASFLILYGLGIIVFLFGLSTPDLYGDRFRLIEIIYKNIAPVILVMLAIPLCFSRNEDFDSLALER